MSPPTITETRPSGHQVGERVELARYTISAGERVIYGQRIDGVVLFLPGEPVVFVRARALSDDDTCGPRRGTTARLRAHAVRQKRHSEERAHRRAAGDGRGVWS
jgi:hypothetical protein